jgi:hypothetical protein
MTPSHVVKNGRRYRYYVPPAGHGGPGDIAERDARAGSPDRATRHRSIRQLFGEPASLIEAAERFRLQATLPLDTALVIPTRVRACARRGAKNAWAFAALA